MAVKKWLRISLFNLFIVSFLGVILRYKIVFSLPFIDQKHLLHGHSHFAFAGWVTQALMALIIASISEQTGKNLFIKYKGLLYGNLIAAYGMLVSFPLQGYGLFSISFSTLSIIISYVFAVQLWKDINNCSKKTTSQLWFKAAVLFNVISSIGTFALMLMMITKTIHQNWYLAAVYFFLHFQYNGWFIFSCMGLLFHQLYKSGIVSTHFNIIFWLFAWACVPAYFLSALWMRIPVWVYVSVVLAAIAQVVGWSWLIYIINNPKRTFLRAMPSVAKWLIRLSAIACSIKLLLQLGSIIPSLSNLAFGFRPIIIGYLHLVLLAVISLFIIGYFWGAYYIKLSKINVCGVFFFTGGIMLNELLLMVQGITAMNYIMIPYNNEALLGATFIMFIGLGMTNYPLSRNNM